MYFSNQVEFLIKYLFWNMTIFFVFLIDIDWSNPYNCQTILGIRSLHQVMTIGNHKPLVIKVREKTCFCDDYIKDNPVSECENIVNGYVSHWDSKEIVRKPPFEDADIDIHDPIYSTDYERVFDLVMVGLWYMHI